MGIQDKKFSIVNRIKNKLIDLSIGQQIVMLIILFLLIIIVSLLSPFFLTKSNILNVVTACSITGVTALGMTFVILMGEIDLSVGSTFALSGSVATGFLGVSYTSAQLAKIVALPEPIAIISGVAVGLALGYANGWIVTGFKIPPFIATLGMMSLARGLTYLYTSGYPITFDNLPPLFAWIGRGEVLSVPIPILILIAVFLMCWWILSFTTFGRCVYAIGGNAEAARASGIKIDRIKRLSYALTGSLAALSGVILASRVAAGSPVAGIGYELDVITGVVIGGTGLKGGHGSVIGTIIGILIVEIIQNALNLLGVSTYYKYITRGLVLILAISLEGYVRRKQTY